MKYFLDTEFIEGFHKPLFGKKRHFIDLISIGVVCEDGGGYQAICNQYNFKDANSWVKENVILPLYINTVHGDARNSIDASNFQYSYGKSAKQIASELLDFFGCWRDQHFYRAKDNTEVYGYYADYDWVLLCSLFGRMIDLPKGFPMYCRDLKQMLDDKVKICMSGKGTPSQLRTFKENTKRLGGMPTVSFTSSDFNKTLAEIKNDPSYPKQENEHNALSDALWNRRLYEFIQTL